MIRVSTAVLVFSITGVGAVLAQTSPTSPSPNPPMVTSPASPSTDSSDANSTAPRTPQTATAPVEGANSFTESQARGRIEDNGYSGVTGLKKDDKGIWRGKATKGGTSVDVSLDYQGNVVAGSP